MNRFFTALCFAAALCSPIAATAQDSGSLTNRQPAYSGTFYPASPRALQDDLDKYFAEAKPARLEYRKLIVPAAGILNSGNVTLHIGDIRPLELDAICQSEKGESWPCGRFARTAMRQLILRRTINCQPAEEENNRLLAKCRIGSRDIGQWLVGQGWAKDIDGKYSEQMETAKQSHRGMWRLKLP